MTTMTTLEQAVQTLPSDADRVTAVLPLTEIIPYADLLFGGGLLVAVVVLHGIGIRLITGHFRSRVRALSGRRTVGIRYDVLLGGVVFLLLLLHLAEIVVWTAALVNSGLASDWRLAAHFCANTYTTVGYGAPILPQAWSMVTPIIAMSGLFTFGWTGSVLVVYVGIIERTRTGIAGPPPG